MTDQLKIAILGAGAMGSFFGAMLARAGEAVTLLDIDEAHLKAIESSGLRLDLNGKTETVTSIKTSPPNALDHQPDLLIVFTKTYASLQALQSVQNQLGSHCHILSLQNGLGNDEILLKFAPSNRLIIGMTTWPAAKLAAGNIKVDGEGMVRMQALDHKPSTFVSNLAARMEHAGLHAKEDQDVWNAIWEKVAFNAAMNAICGVTGCTVGQLTSINEGRQLVYATVKEAITVAAAMGVSANLEHCLKTVDFALANHTHHKPSMLQDIEAGRRTEIMSINGKIADYADRQNVAAPINRLLTTLIRMKTQS